MLKAVAQSALAVVGGGFVATMLLVLLTGSVLAESIATPAPTTILQTACSTCHESKAPGQYARISSVRKTPEGWLMTLVRIDRKSVV